MRAMLYIEDIVYFVCFDDLYICFVDVILFVRGCIVLLIMRKEIQYLKKIYI